MPADLLAQSRHGGSRGGAVRTPPSHAGSAGRPSGGHPGAGRPVSGTRPPSGGAYRGNYYRGAYNGGAYYRGSAYYRGYGHGYRGYGYGYRGYGYGYRGYGYGYGYRPYGYYGYGYGWPYYGLGFGFGIGYPYWGAYSYGWGYPYAWGGYYGGYYPSYHVNDALGSAQLKVSPRETEVFVDGYFAGVVDDFDGFSQRLRLEPGEHEVTLFLEGHRPLTRKMLFTVGQTFKIQHAMEPLGAGEPPPQRPVASGKLPAPGRTRYGQPGTQRPGPGQPADPANVDPGDPGAPGDRGVEVSIVEPPDSPPRTDRATPPDEARGPSGTLSIRVQPDDAEVVIDGEPWARSGGERLVVALAPGVHRLEVRKGGHETYTGLIRIRPGVATSLNVALATAGTR